MLNRKTQKNFHRYIRPAAEYLSVAWHSSLTADQAAMIEREQTQALCHIFGWGPSARKMRDQAGLDLLSKRREAAVNRMAKRLRDSPRFGHHFRDIEGRRNTPRRRSNKSMLHEQTVTETHPIII